MKGKPRLVLVDDHALMVEGLRAVLEPEHEVVDVVRNGEEVLASVERYHPDVVLLDLSLPGRSGLDVAAELHRRHPEVRTIIVTMHAERMYADEALKVGASGYVLKLARTEELRFAIAEALDGRQYVTPLLTKSAARDQKNLVPRGMPDAGGLAALTDRQREVLRLIAQGRTGPEIAAELGLSDRSVEFHRGQIKGVLGLSSTAALVRYAVTEGLV